jgi:ribosomal protein S26
MRPRKGYSRGWKHGKERGKETLVTCAFCGRQVPKYKTFSVVRGFRITDPLLREELKSGNRRGISLMSSKMYACPACARHRHIVRRKKR